MQTWKKRKALQGICKLQKATKSHSKKYSYDLLQYYVVSVAYPVFHHCLWFVWYIPTVNFSSIFWSFSNLY